MANVGSLIVDLALESGQFIAGLKKAQAATSQTATSISSAMNTIKGAAAGLAGAISVGAILDATRAAFDYADAIQDLSDRTGASTKFIQEFRYAAQLAGSSTEDADTAVQKFSKNLGSAASGNQQMLKSLKDLGVTSTDVDTALKQASDGIAKLPTRAQQAAKTVELFGKSAQNLTLTMAGGSAGLSDFAQRAEQLGIVLDADLINNAGKVNDQLDTMKMVLNAQMANAIIQNADAIATLGNAFMTAAGQAAHFFEQMDVNRLMSLQQNNPLKMDIPSVIKGFLEGKTLPQTQDEGRERLKSFHAGRAAIYAANAHAYNDGIRAGKDPNSLQMQALRAEMEQVKHRDALASKGTSAPIVKSPPLPGLKPEKAKAEPKDKDKTDAELLAKWDKAFLGAKSDLYGAQSRLTTDPTELADLQTKQLRNHYFTNVAEVDGDTGTDEEVRAGKKKYTAAQAELLKDIEKQIFDAQYDDAIHERDAEIAKDRLDIAESSLKTDSDMLSAELSLARSTQDRRDKALKLVDNQFEQERLQLENTVALAALGKATKAEADAAQARLKALPALQALAKDGARKQNQSPLESYLDAIPKTSGEINDALENVEVDGLKSLQDGLAGIIDGTKSVGEAFSDMSKTIINGLIKIGLEQAIIKPLGNLLFGGGDSGGGGLLGSIFGGLLKGARANGGMTSPGNYLVGERGPEVVSIGANANVMNNRAMRAAANDNKSGVTVNFGAITSNDPVMVKALATQAAMELAPMFQQQAVNATMTKFRRPGL